VQESLKGKENEVVQVLLCEDACMYSSIGMKNKKR